MKKCTWCGKEYPDDATVCAMDQQPLQSNIPPVISAPIIPAEPHEETSSTSDMLFRAVACVVAGVVGYWYPLWYVTHRMPQIEDDRSGWIFAWGLLFIIGFAVWATLGLRLLPVIADKRKRLSLITGIVVLCWSPLIFTILGILFMSR